EGGSPNHDPGAETCTDPPVQESEGEEIQAKGEKHDKEFDGINQRNAEAPGKSPDPETAAEQKSQTGCDTGASLAQREQERGEAKPRQNPGLRRLRRANDHDARNQQRQAKH